MKTVIHSFVTTRLDYCILALYMDGLAGPFIARLELVKNADAHL